MLPEFAHFVQSIFPAVSSAETRKLLRAAGAFGVVNGDYFSTQLGSPLAQGDVVEGLPFVVQREDGTFGRATRPGMLLSHSCDVDSAAWLTFAVCQKHEPRAKNASSIERNEITELFFLPSHGVRPATIVDFGQLQTLKASVVADGLRSGNLQRVDSFTDLGYYLLIAKLTIHFLRPQAADERRMSSAPPFRDRVGYAARAVRALPSYVLFGRN